MAEEIQAMCIEHFSAPAEASAASSASAAEQVPASAARSGALLQHRLTGEGLLATGFEPERHAVMVLGRPVQAAAGGAAPKSVNTRGLPVMLSRTTLCCGAKHEARRSVEDECNSWRQA